MSRTDGANRCTIIRWFASRNSNGPRFYLRTCYWQNQCYSDLQVGSFVPWLYYSFYCDRKPQIIYLSIVIGLGIGAVVVSTFDFFAGPRFRPLRAGNHRFICQYYCLGKFIRSIHKLNVKVGKSQKVFSIWPHP